MKDNKKFLINVAILLVVVLVLAIAIYKRGSTNPTNPLTDINKEGYEENMGEISSEHNDDPANTENDKEEIHIDSGIGDDTEIKPGKPVDFLFNGTAKEFDEILLTDRPTIVTFGAEWCVYCKDLQPIMEKFNKEYKDQINIIYVDVDKHQDITMRYPVQVTPATMLMLPGGKPINLTEEIFHNYGIDGFISKEGGPIEATGFFGLKPEENIKKMIDEVVLEQ